MSCAILLAEIFDDETAVTRLDGCLRYLIDPGAADVLAAVRSLGRQLP